MVYCIRCNTLLDKLWNIGKVFAIALDEAILQLKFLFLVTFQCVWYWFVDYLFIHHSCLHLLIQYCIYLFIYRVLSARVRQVQQGCVWRKPPRSTCHCPHSVMSYQHWLMARAHTSHIVTQSWLDCCRIPWGETLRQSWWVLANFVLTYWLSRI